MCREPRKISRDRDGGAGPGGLRRRREAAIDGRVAEAGARHHGQSAAGPRRSEPTERAGRADRERAHRAAERRRQAHRDIARSGRPADVLAAPRRGARVAESRPDAGGAERLRPRGADRSGAARVAAPARLGDDDAGGRSLPNRSRAATKQGHRRGDPHLLRPDRDISRKPAARERAVPGGRRVLQAEGLARRAGRVRGAGRGRAAGREGPRRAREDRSLSKRSGRWSASEANVGARHQRASGERRGAPGQSVTPELGPVDVDDISRMDLDDRGLADQRDGEDQAGHAILAQELAADTRERAAHDLDVHAFGQERMRIVLKSRAGQALDRRDLSVRHRLGSAAGPDEVGDADDVQDAKALDEREAREAIAGKERESDLLAPVLPPAPALGNRQEGLDFAAYELIAHRLFVTGARSYHVPEGIEPLVAVLTVRVRFS